MYFYTKQGIIGDKLHRTEKKGMMRCLKLIRII